jgi:hypothetical protein
VAGVVSEAGSEKAAFEIIAASSVEHWMLTTR